MYSSVKYILFYCHHVVDLVIYFCFAENVKFFDGIHHLAFIGNVNCLYDILYWADEVPILYQILGKTGFTTSVFEIPKLFVETDFEISVGLSDIFFIACGTRYLIDRVCILCGDVLLQEVYLWYFLYRS